MNELSKAAMKCRCATTVHWIDSTLANLQNLTAEEYEKDEFHELRIASEFKQMSRQLGNFRDFCEIDTTEIERMIRKAQQSYTSGDNDGVQSGVYMAGIFLGDALHGCCDWSSKYYIGKPGPWH